MKVKYKMGKNTKVLAIIQARLESTRLKGKVLKEVIGKPLLWYIVNRLQDSVELSDIILAIPNSKPNNKLEDFAREVEIKCFRGSEEDVLSRYYNAASAFGGDLIVRITADNPLIDPRLIDSTILSHLSTQADYTYSRGFPLGLNSEVINFIALERAFKEASQDCEREHVTPYLYQNPNLFKINIIEAIGKLKRPELRFTVDTEEDLALIREIYRQLYHDKQLFCAEDVIDLLDRYPEMLAINSHIKQKVLG